MPQPIEPETATLALPEITMDLSVAPAEAMHVHVAGHGHAHELKHPAKQSRRKLCEYGTSVDPACTQRVRAEQERADPHTHGKRSPPKRRNTEPTKSRVAKHPLTPLCIRVRASRTSPVYQRMLLNVIAHRRLRREHPCIELHNPLRKPFETFHCKHRFDNSSKHSQRFARNRRSNHTPVREIPKFNQFLDLGERTSARSSLERSTR
eukprot:Amastigsp_a2616_39.p2 type:complete len:207 gc:universal Amastigsp_a2616_39:740-120(-)